MDMGSLRRKSAEAPFIFPVTMGDFLRLLGNFYKAIFNFLLQ